MKKKRDTETVEGEEIEFLFSRGVKKFNLELELLDNEPLGKIPLLVLTELKSEKELLRMSLSEAIDLKASIDKFILHWLEDKNFLENEVK